MPEYYADGKFQLEALLSITKWVNYAFDIKTRERVNKWANIFSVKGKQQMVH